MGFLSNIFGGGDTKVTTTQAGKTKVTTTVTPKINVKVEAANLKPIQRGIQSGFGELSGSLEQIGEGLVGSQVALATSAQEQREKAFGQIKGLAVTFGKYALLTIGGAVLVWAYVRSR